MKKLKKDFTGVKIYHLTGVKYLRSDKNIPYRATWLWRCDCGNMVESYSGVKQSCGCDNIKRLKILSSNNILPNNQGFKNKLFTRYKNDAIKRNLQFRLTKAEFESFLDKNCHYCDEPPSNEMLTTLVSKKLNSRTFKHSGIDRKINSVGYVFSNCVPCCYVCNKMKMNLDYEIFINQILKIKSHIETNRNI